VSIECKATRLEPIRVEPLTGIHPNGRLLALHANIRLWWKKMALANALAYNDLTTFTAVKFLRAGPR
jgi:hypothetical protein